MKNEILPKLILLFDGNLILINYILISWFWIYSKRDYSKSNNITMYYNNMILAYRDHKIQPHDI